MAESRGSEQAGGPEPAAAAGAVEEAPQPLRRSASCVPAFDALWFCYSPVHQMTQYYRDGEFDGCTARWSALWHCMANRARGGASSEAQPREEPAASHAERMWELRTPEAAAEFWRQQYGTSAEQPRVER
eukprot:SM000042S15347  [mRNA]  locus=s42:507733:508447:+ [translate_table: standard]